MISWRKLVTLPIVAVLLGGVWVYVLSRQYHGQHVVIQELTRFYRETHAQVPYVELGPGEPAWLGALIAKQDFCVVRTVELPGGLAVSRDGIIAILRLKRIDTLSMFLTVLNDDAMAAFSSFPARIRRLDLSCASGLRDHSLRDLSGIRDLTELDLGGASRIDGTDIGYLPDTLVWLSLRGTDITDSALHDVTTLQNIEYLDVSGCAVSDQGVMELARLPKLRSLNVARTRVTGRFIQQFANPGALSVLDLSGNHLDRDRLRDLQLLPQLRDVCLANTNVNDEDIVQICSVSLLSTLSLEGTAITDNALAIVGNTTSLREIGVAGTRVTPQAITRFGRLRPDVTVTK